MSWLLRRYPVHGVAFTIPVKSPKQTRTALFICATSGLNNPNLRRADPFDTESAMPHERITTIELGDYLDRQIDEGLKLLRKRNPESQITRDQFIRVVVGYGLDQILRRRGRAKVHLNGNYRKAYSPGEDEAMTVVDLSLSGARFEAAGHTTVRVNELLHIHFQLEDSTQTVIQKDVIVRNARRRNVGVAFVEAERDNRLKDFLDKLTAAEELHRATHEP